MFATGLIIGMFLGAVCGVFIVALCMAARESDQEERG